MHFCPICGNLLLMEDSEVNDRDRTSGGMRFCCATCPYLHKITKAYKTNVKIKKKEIDDVLGGEEAWANVDRTEAQCPACKHNTAFFLQIQIRSADEPSTTFYRCCKCSKQWNDK